MKKIHSLSVLAFVSFLLPLQAIATKKTVHELVYDLPNQSAKMEFDEGHNEVYKAVQQGLIKPYSVLNKKVTEELNGRIIHVELEEDDDLWIYELKLLHNNNVIKAEYNANTLELMELKGRHLMSVIKR